MCLSWMSPKINLTCMGLGLLEIDFGNQVLCGIGTGISFALLVCYGTGIIHLICFWVNPEHTRPSTYLNFYSCTIFPCPKGMKTWAPAKSPMQLSLM
jgi:hypothetical protein